MLSSLLLMLQLAASVAAANASGFDLRSFNFRTTVAAKPCTATANSDEIVVCADRSDRYRLRELLAGRFEAKPLVAGTQIGNGSVGVNTEQKIFPGDIPSTRIMLTLKVAF